MTESGANLRVDGFGTDMLSSDTRITPQPAPTSPRIKELLSRALTKPETLSPAERQEMAASLVYHLIAERKS